MTISKTKKRQVFLAERGEILNQFTVSLIVLILLLPIMYILPLGFSKKGKKIIILVSALLAIIGLLASNILTLTTAIVVLLITSIIFTVLLEKNYGESLLVNDFSNAVTENNLIGQVLPNDAVIQNNNMNNDILAFEQLDENLEMVHKIETKVLDKNLLNETIENNSDTFKSNNISRFEKLIANNKDDQISKTEDIIDDNDIDQHKELESLNKNVEEIQSDIVQEEVNEDYQDEIQQVEVIDEEIFLEQIQDKEVEKNEQLQVDMVSYPDQTQDEVIEEDQQIQVEVINEESYPEQIQDEEIEEDQQIQVGVINEESYPEQTQDEEIEEDQQIQVDVMNEESHPEQTQDEAVEEDNMFENELVDENIEEINLELVHEEIVEETNNESEIQLEIKRSFNYQIVDTLTNQLELEVALIHPNEFKQSINKLLLSAVDTRQRFTLHYILAKNLLVFKKTDELIELIQELKEEYSNYPMLLLNLDLFTLTENNLLDKVEKYEKE
ncbi:MAG: hypothetical protein K0S51_210 [Bacillales bacterium]|nr:hypothetical protein [Bacillales bacterium]